MDAHQNKTPYYFKMTRKIHFVTMSLKFCTIVLGIAIYILFNFTSFFFASYFTHESKLILLFENIAGNL